MKAGRMAVGWASGSWYYTKAMSPLREVLNGRGEGGEDEVIFQDPLGHHGDEEFFVESQPETVFDQTVGAIEDIVIGEGFQELQSDLLEKHFHHFDVSYQKLQHK